VTLVLISTLLLSAAAHAQFRPTPQTGLHYFAMENLTRGTVDLRGQAGSNGVAHDTIALAPNTTYRHWILQAATLQIGFAQFSTPSSGQRIELPAVFLAPSTAPDGDRDELPDDAEFVMGTDPKNADSDRDGVKDGAEVKAGTDPLDGLPARTGLIATADTAGNAVDVCAFDDVVAVADSDAGVTVFNVFNGMNPLIIAQVDTPGSAERVACAESQVAVADGSRGLAVIDLTDPPAARIVHQVNFSSAAQAVVIAGGVAYVGLQGGQLAAVDLRSGTLLDQLEAGGPVHDLAVEGDTLYLLREDELQAYSVLPDFEFLGRATPTNFRAEGITQRKRLFVGGNIAYVTSFPGFDTFDVSDPRAMRLLGTARDAGPNSFKQIVANGSGLAVAAVGINPREDGTHDVFLYDISDPANTTAFLTQFATPGTTRAVTIFNGLAYAADSTFGLQVLNYLAPDTAGVPPTIALRSNFVLGMAEEGQIVRISADVADDVQVRNVEFLIDGIKVATDGNFPFEHRFTAPLLRDRASFRLQARASDTGGNFTLTDEIVVTLVRDARAPRVTRVSPRDGAVAQAANTIAAFFNEPIAPNTLTQTNFALVAAGADEQFGTADDVAVAGAVEFRDDVRGAFRTQAAALPGGRYRGTLNTAVTDLAGNGLTARFSWQFTIFEVGPDSDGDGVPDDLEPILGLDPSDADSDDDGTPDGAEDFDDDGLPNAGEVVLRTDPTDADSDDDGVEDGAEDSDGDGLSDGDESRRGTNPLASDSDADGWPDGAEVDAGSNPSSAASQPRVTSVARPVVSVVVPELGDVMGLEANTTIALPPVSVVVPALGDVMDLPPSTTVAQPPVSVVVPAPGDVMDLPPSTTVAQPPVSVTVPALGDAMGVAPGTTVARPPVTVLIQGQ
jgi:hypothetical protein